MTTQSQIPAKWYVPFANGDASRVEIPVTTTDPTRASQTLGFPPLTMQPPESGGVPPQGEDFNGGMNQIARVAWWVLNAGGWPFDASFATNVNIGGYPKGATVQGADFQGEWISNADSNTNNPDTGSGTAWVPGFQYGSTALSALTGGTVTPTPAQAAKNGISLAGTLTSALTVVLPAWVKNWTITNNTTGAFVTIVKTAAGSGVTIPQNGHPTRVSGDGTNIVQAAENIAPATTTTDGLQLGQAGHGQCRLSVVSTTQLKLAPYNGANVLVNGIPLTLAAAGVTVSNSGLAASTLYYVYLAGTTAAPVLNLSTTTHATGTNGVEVKSGDATQTLVGMVFTNASTQFVDSATVRTCLNWFNRRALPASIVTSGSINFTTGSNAEISTAVRLLFLTWGDEGVPINLMGQYTNNTAGASVSIQSYVDAAAYGNISASYVGVANAGTTYASGNSLTAAGTALAEGLHTAAVYGSVTGGTGTSSQMAHSLIVRG